MNVKEANKALIQEMSKQILSECLKLHFRGMSSELTANDDSKLNECMYNFMYSYGIVAGAWDKQLADSFSGKD